MMAWRAAAAVAALACAAAGPALADTAPLFVFHAPPEAIAQAQAARAALEASAARRGSVLVDLSEPAEPAARAPAHLRRAIEAYHDLRHADALAEASAGLDEAAATGALGLSPTELSDLLLYRALALTEQGDAARAWDDFVRAAALDPARKLDPVRFAPRAVEAFARASGAVAEAPTASLTVALAPDCAVWLDGRAAQPGARLTTTRGEHYLRARCPGHAPHGERLLIAGPEHRVEPALRPRRPPTARRVREVARARGFSAALWAEAVPEAGGRALLVLRLVDDTRAAGASSARRSPRRIALRIGAGAAGAVEAAVARLLEPVVEVTGPVAVRPAPRARWYRQPWFWGLVGAAAASAVLVPLAIDSDPPSGFDLRPGGDLP